MKKIVNNIDVDMVYDIPYLGYVSPSQKRRMVSIARDLVTARDHTGAITYSNIYPRSYIKNNICKLIAFPSLHDLCEWVQGSDIHEGQPIQNSETIFYDQVSHDLYIGAEIDNADGKYMITRREWGSGAYQVRCADAFTQGNGLWSSGESLEDVLLDLLNRGFSCYAFDTPKELFKWLSE